jgi:hypothetical protein
MVVLVVLMFVSFWIPTQLLTSPALGASQNPNVGVGTKKRRHFLPRHHFFLFLPTFFANRRHFRPRGKIPIGSVGVGIFLYFWDEMTFHLFSICSLCLLVLCLFLVSILCGWNDDETLLLLRVMRKVGKSWADVERLFNEDTTGLYRKKDNFRRKFNLIIAEKKKWTIRQWTNSFVSPNTWKKICFSLQVLTIFQEVIHERKG